MSVITCPHPSPFPKGEEIGSHNKILWQKTTIFLRFTPLSRGERGWG